MISEMMRAVLRNVFRSTAVSKLKKQMERWKETGYSESLAEISRLVLKLFQFVLSFGFFFQHVSYSTAFLPLSAFLNCPYP